LGTLLLLLTEGLITRNTVVYYRNFRKILKKLGASGLASMYLLKNKAVKF
jgi:hypothetical protein